MERTEENNATKDRFAHVGKTFSEMDSEKLQAEITERSKIIKRKIDALMGSSSSSRRSARLYCGSSQSMTATL